MRIVGLVRDAKYTSLREPEPPTVYFALFQHQRLYPWMTYQVLLERPAATAAGQGGLLPPSVGSILAAIGPDVRLRVDTLAAFIDDSLAQERMLAVLSALFGAAALLLCAIGVHGIVSYGVAHRPASAGRGGGIAASDRLAFLFEPGTAGSAERSDGGPAGGLIRRVQPENHSNIAL